MSDGMFMKEWAENLDYQEAVNFVETFERELIVMLGPIHLATLKTILKAYELFSVPKTSAESEGVNSSCTFAAKELLNRFIHQGEKERVDSNQSLPNI